jgi:hypothetical protein
VGECRNPQVSGSCFSSSEQRVLRVGWLWMDLDALRLLAVGGKNGRESSEAVIRCPADEGDPDLIGRLFEHRRHVSDLDHLAVHAVNSDSGLFGQTRGSCCGEASEVYRTGRPARKDLRADQVLGSGPVADELRSWGFCSAVSAPIVVEGRLWGILNALLVEIGCRLTQRYALESSPSSSQPRSRTRRADRSCQPRAGGSSLRRTRPVAESSAISTMGHNSGLFRSGWRCALRRGSSHPSKAVFERNCLASPRASMTR